MKIDRSHFSWLLFVIVATLATAVLYVANFYPGSLPIPIKFPPVFGDVPPTRHTFGGTPLGLVLGSIAFAIFLFASALGIRKKKRLWPMGSVQLWLKAHIWLTILTIPLILFHCGFRSGGSHTTWLVILYVVVMASGFFGLALQQFMPGLMKERLPREVVFEQIPVFRGRLIAAAVNAQINIRQMVTAGIANKEPDDASPETLNLFIEKECLLYLKARRGDNQDLGNERLAAERFRTLKLNLAGEWHAMVDDLARWCSERRVMDLQTSYQHWLHGWLLVHVPASFALLVFTAWHAWIAVRFLVIG